jgi:Flp pilus assembly protein TadG
MPYMFNITKRVADALQGYRKNNNGVAAVEFAFIAPIMVTLFIGIVELSYGLSLVTQVQQVANSTADLVARAENQIKQSDITDIMTGSSFIFSPFNPNAATITLRQVNSSPANANSTKQAWSCTYTASSGALACACTNTAFTIPANLVTTNDTVVLSQVSYDYVPFVFNHFLRNNLSSLSDGAGGYNLSETAYRKPRGATGMLLQNNGVPCPSPTFP